MKKTVLEKKVLVLGDSHSAVFQGLKITKYPCEYGFQVIFVGGATASGLENPNAKTDAYNIYSTTMGSDDATMATMGSQRR